MNKLRILVPALAMVFLTACATTQSTAQFTTSQDATLVDQYLDAVNASAAANHAEVHWINVPEEKDLVRYKKD